VIAALLGVCAACDQPWKPASVVDSLRVIGVRAEPPEVHPGEVATLSTLLLDPTRPGQKSTVLWLGCDPDPFGAGRGACGDLDALQDPTALVDVTQLPAGVHVIGIDDRAAYSAPANLFDVLDAGDVRRQAGAAGVVMSLAVAADVPFTASREQLAPIFQKVQSKEIASQLTLFRVMVSEATEAQRNHNPVIDDLTVNGAVVPSGATVQLWPLIDNPLDLTAHDAEQYDEVTPTMTEHKTELLVASWYTTAGRFTQDRVALDSDVKSKLTGPGDTKTENDPIPDNRRGTLWAVVRDSRGGQVWRAWPWYLCDGAAPSPRVTSVERDSSGTVLHGENLDQVLDVIASGAALHGGYSSGTGTWQGDPSSGPLQVRAKNGTRLPAP
jgi:hypothetical protein